MNSQASLQKDEKKAVSYTNNRRQQQQTKRRVRTPKDENILELTFDEDSESEDHSQSDESFDFNDEENNDMGCFNCKPHLFGLNDQLLEMTADSD